MKWSWKLGTVAGIGLYVHGTFLLLLGWVGLSHWIEGGSAAAALAGVGFVVALFACVVLHELGHALTAQRFGIRTRDITLLPIGGVARLERMPDDPRQEVAVALAGPAVNVVIAAALYLWLSLSETLRPLAALSVTGGPVLQRLMVVNLSLAVFNLLPAFPMDGGRVLRALLAMRMDYTRATQLAAQVGQAMALLFGFVGLFANPFLLFIAFFVWIGAAQEASMVQMRSALGGIPVSRAMLTDFETLAPGDPGRRVLDLIIAGSQSDFPVVEDGAWWACCCAATSSTPWRSTGRTGGSATSCGGTSRSSKPGRCSRRRSRACNAAPVTRSPSRAAARWSGSSPWTTWASSC